MVANIASTSPQQVWCPCESIQKAPLGDLGHPWTAFSHESFVNSDCFEKQTMSKNKPHEYQWSVAAPNYRFSTSFHFWQPYSSHRPHCDAPLLQLNDAWSSWQNVTGDRRISKTLELCWLFGTAIKLHMNDIDGTKRDKQPVTLSCGTLEICTPDLYVAMLPVMKLTPFSGPIDRTRQEMSRIKTDAIVHSSLPFLLLTWIPLSIASAILQEGTKD